MLDFLCIGAQKAATTWLMANLSKHPGVWTPRFIKEVHYFDVLYLGTKRKQVLNSYARRGAKLLEKNPALKDYLDRVTDPSFAFTDDWYSHIFSSRKAGTTAGECTPFYCALPEDGVAHVKRLNPNLRVVYMIRDPFARMLSSMRMKMDRQKITDGSLVEHLLDDPHFLARGDYRSNIPRWEACFPTESIHYIPFGRVKNDPKSVLRDVEKHLGLKAYGGYPKMSDQVHPTKKDDKVFGENLIQRINDLVAPQYEFLTQKWGAEFVASIR